MSSALEAIKTITAKRDVDVEAINLEAAERIKPLLLLILAENPGLDRFGWVPDADEDGEAEVAYLLSEGTQKMIDVRPITSALASIRGPMTAFFGSEMFVEVSRSGVSAKPWRQL